MKKLLREAGIPVAKFAVFMRGTLNDKALRQAVKRLKYPLFVKPANMGSSVGISRVNKMVDLKKAIKEAIKYDRKILLEEMIKGREIECSVLGNDEPEASLPGEVITRHEFYSYTAKYIDEQGAELVYPVKLPAKKIKEIQELAIKAFQALECSGMARVDMFLQFDGKLVLNEINTLPGFTKISMYPKLWEVCGLTYSKLLNRLIELAMERRKEKEGLKRSYEVE